MFNLVVAISGMLFARDFDIVKLILKAFLKVNEKLHTGRLRNLSFK